jgi:hypothetical protein
MKNKLNFLWFVCGALVIAILIYLQRKKSYNEAYNSEATGTVTSVLNTRDAVNVTLQNKSFTVSPFSSGSHIKFDEIALDGDTVIKQAKSDVLVLKHAGKAYYYFIEQ